MRNRQKMISVIMPAYQEAENLVKILPELKSSLEAMELEYEIIVVDTVQAMDQTKDICIENEVYYTNRKGGNLYGDAIQTGIEHATGQYVVIMDADGSHNPEDIIRFYREISKTACNLVIGSRYCKGGYTDNIFILRFMSWVLNVTYRVLFGLKVKDVSDSFRMYVGEELKSVKLECDNFDIVEEILIKLNYTIPNYTVREIPISFNKRVAGESKRNLPKFIFSYIKTIRRLMRIKKSLNCLT